MTELTPAKIHSQLAWLSRYRRGLCRDYTAAHLASDETEMHSIRAEYRLIGNLMAKLRGELREFEALQSEQVAAVVFVEELLNLS
jgi:hypothetical protein